MTFGRKPNVFIQHPIVNKHIKDVILLLLLFMKIFKTVIAFANGHSFVSL